VWAAEADTEFQATIEGVHPGLRVHAFVVPEDTGEPIGSISMIG
jgi:hypothetical protein